jgi:hypothetical protein
MKRGDFNYRLKQNYTKLSNSSLVLSGDISEKSLDYFQRVLNSVQPKTEMENTYKTVLRNMKDVNKYGLLMFVKNRHSSHFVQLLDSLSIVRHFNIHNMVFLKWDRSSNQYIVSPLVRKDQETKEEDRFETKKPTLVRSYSSVVASPEIVIDTVQEEPEQETHHTSTSLSQTIQTTDSSSVLHTTSSKSIGSWADTNPDSE